MTQPREIEIKLELPERALARLMKSPLIRKANKGILRPAYLVSVYYDTDKRKLRKHGLTLRVRRTRRRYTQTIKRDGDTNSALMDRFEWEHDIAGGKPNLDLARNTGLESILDKKLQAKLKPLFETRVRRNLYLIQNGSEIELAIDKGTVVAGRKSLPICEVELELKHGDAADLFKVARELAKQVPIELSVISKSERGFALIDSMKPQAIAAEPVVISPDASSQAAFQTIARACLHQIVANQRPARAGISEGIHQARVGLRRLRAAISLFGGMLADPQSDAIKQELKWITLELGPARELDVFIKLFVNPDTAGRATGLGVATMTRELRSKRRDALDRVRSAIESDRFRTLALDTAAWIEFGDWTRNPDDVARAIRGRPIETTAAGQMQRYRKKITKQAKSLVDINPTERHKRRIEAKKLRYASEFFGATFPGRKANRRRKKFIASLGRLQDTLGDLNDISVNEGLTERLVETRQSDRGGKHITSSKAFAAGRLSGREEARFASVLKAADRAFARFASAKPFWR